MHFVYPRVLEALWLLFVYSILIQPLLDIQWSLFYKYATRSGVEAIDICPSTSSARNEIFVAIECETN